MMKTEVISSSKGGLSLCLMGEEERIARASDFLELLVNCPTSTVVIDKDSLAPAFFELRSGLAGECLQKVSNYGKRLIVLGEYGKVSSRALKDFIYESNRTGKVIFTETLAGAIEMLK
jgi:hypothetical protein